MVKRQHFVYVRCTARGLEKASNLYQWIIQLIHCILLIIWFIIAVFAYSYANDVKKCNGSDYVSGLLIGGFVMGSFGFSTCVCFDIFLFCLD